MTPGARVAAAIEILDVIGAGTVAEAALTAWARRSRFAGSKDRAAVRNHVFDALRNWQSHAALGGATQWPPRGRAVMIGQVRATGADLDALFNGQGHAPTALSDAERHASTLPADIWNLPDWLLPFLSEGRDRDTAFQQAEQLTQRAPITLRVNTGRTTRDELQAQLAQDGFECDPNPLARTALTLTGHSRGLVRTLAFEDGLFEMQDAASQAVVETLGIAPNARILDYCAGGGGKTLALANQTTVPIMAHDVDPRRMKDLPVRAVRAGAQVQLTEDPAPNGYDLVLVDAPCSGSGSWRRAPDAKWRLTPERLDELCAIQKEILATTQQLVAPGGVLAYVTCSILQRENDDQIQAFLDVHPDWTCAMSRDWPVAKLGDGFFATQLLRK